MGGGEEFVRKDLELASGFAEAARAAGIERIIYRGAQRRVQLSRHLSSRQEVGRATEVPVVELRAAVILGSGSTSFEMMRYLTERLPAMICPRWGRTRTEPIAISGVLEYLVRAAGRPARRLRDRLRAGDELPGHDARLRKSPGFRYRPILNVPFSRSISGYLVARSRRSTARSRTRSSRAWRPASP